MLDFTVMPGKGSDFNIKAQAANDWHPHPQNLNKKVFGRTLDLGEVLQGGDLTDAVGGEWEPVACRGLPVQHGHAGIFIRPA